MVTWRQDAHTFPLLFWTMLCVATGIILLDYSRHSPTTALGAGERILVVGLLMVAPAALAVYLWRARRVWVSIDPERGLWLPDRRLILWEKIRRVRWRRPLFRRRQHPQIEVERTGHGDSVLKTAFNAGAGMGLVAVLLKVTWAMLVSVTTLLLDPVIEVFTPFGERFMIETTSGRPLVLRDLRDADAFAEGLRLRVRVEG